MEKNLKVAFIQYDIIWEDAKANRTKIEEILSDFNETFDLLILPEMFTTGFSMNTHNIAEYSDGETKDWMIDLAKKYQSVITGSIVIKEDDQFYNRLLWIDASGAVQKYDKKHLFRLAKEDLYFSPGKTKEIFEVKNVYGEAWKVCPLICYDLRFPVWSRNVEDYDLLIYVANFPEKRKYAWRHLLISRAIENQCYTIGVNRIGVDGTQIPYSGESLAIDYDGQVLVDAGKNEGIYMTALNKDKHRIYKRAYNFLNDRDHFEILE